MVKTTLSRKPENAIVNEAWGSVMQSLQHYDKCANMKRAKKYLDLASHLKETARWCVERGGLHHPSPGKMNALLEVMSDGCALPMGKESTLSWGGLFPIVDRLTPCGRVMLRSPSPFGADPDSRGMGLVPDSRSDVLKLLVSLQVEHPRERKTSTLHEDDISCVILTKLWKRLYHETPVVRFAKLPWG